MLAYRYQVQLSAPRIVEEAGGVAIISDVSNDYRVDAKFTNGKLN